MRAAPMKAAAAVRPIVKAGKISAGPIAAPTTAAPTTAATHIAMVAEINAARIAGPTAGRIIAGPIAAPIIAATLIATAAEINAVRIIAALTGGRITAATPIATVAETKGVRIAAATGVTPITVMTTAATLIVMAAAINGGWIAGATNPAITINPNIMAGVTTDMATDRTGVTAISAPTTTSFTIITATIRWAGCLSASATTSTADPISAIAMWFRRHSIAAAVNMRKWRYCATTGGATAISNQAAAGSTAPTDGPDK